MRRILPILLLTVVAGCCHQTTTARETWYKDTVSLQELVGRVNANVEHLPTLWAKGDFDAHIVDHGKETNISGDIKLLYQRPQNMLLYGTADVAGEVFRLGSSQDKYWLRIKPNDTAWWGTYAKIDQADPRAIPVRPDLVEAVLGVDPIDTDLSREPFPVMRFNNDQSAYMVVWNVRGPNRWLAQKEIWYDVKTKLPIMVNLFDANGRVVLGAYLLDHKPVDMGDTDTKGSQIKPPMVATTYKLFFPDSGSWMHLHFNELYLSHNEHPKIEDFNFDPATAGVEHVNKLDPD